MRTDFEPRPHWAQDHHTQTRWDTSAVSIQEKFVLAVLILNALGALAGIAVVICML